MAKNNHGTFRYSDRVVEILDNFEGRSRNEKLENLVLFCFDAVPKQQRQLEVVRKQIQEESKKLYDLRRKMQDMGQLIQTLNTLEHYGNIAARVAQKIAEEYQAEAEPAPKPAKAKRTTKKSV